MTKKIKFSVRKMIRRDLNQVLEIERLSFKQPYSREIFEEELKIKAAKVWVATYRHKILAYIDFWCVAKDMELVSIAVHPKYSRRGIAQHLIQEMIRYASLHKVKSISLDVRTSNKGAQKLYKKFGFKKVGLRKRYYSDNHEDAIMMKKGLQCKISRVR